MRAALAEPEIATKKGKPVSVILPIKQYQEMMERLEDAEDVAWLKKAHRKKLRYRPFEEALRACRDAGDGAIRRERRLIVV